MGAALGLVCINPSGFFTIWHMCSFPCSCSCSNKRRSIHPATGLDHRLRARLRPPAGITSMSSTRPEHEHCTGLGMFNPSGVGFFVNPTEYPLADSNLHHLNFTPAYHHLHFSAPLAIYMWNDFFCSAPLRFCVRIISSRQRQRFLKSLKHSLRSLQLCVLSAKE
jgi:hypothetical protein